MNPPSNQLSFTNHIGAKKFQTCWWEGCKRACSPTPAGGSERVNSVHCCPPPAGVRRVLANLVIKCLPLFAATSRHFILAETQHFHSVTAPHLLDSVSSVAGEPNFTWHLDLLGRMNVQFCGVDHDARCMRMLRVPLYQPVLPRALWIQ